MIPLAALSGPLPKAGVVVAAGVVAIALLAPDARARAWAMLVALLLAPALLLADIWHSPQLSIVHRHPAVAAAIGAGALLAVIGLAVLIWRRPSLLALLVLVALPFRIPIAAGGATANLLVPLYLVVGAGVLALIVPALVGRARAAGEPGSDGLAEAATPAGWLERLLALYVVLYALQAIYSPDFEKALQQMVFFYVPFALLFCLLRRLRWSPALLRRCLIVIVGLALLLAAFGFVEYATKTLFLNPKLIAENSVHTYFAINSVFFDADIFGRFLALVMVLLAAVLLYSRTGRTQLEAIGALAVLWAALVLTLSRSSLGALLVGLGVLGAMRWKAKPIIAVTVAVALGGIVAVVVSPNTFGLNQGLNGASSGRAGLVGGGLRLFGDRPGWGYGSGSFQTEYHRIHPASAQSLSASHTIPVTIAAEQGLIGELAYLALVIHTLLYADFLEDPVTWTLLGLGTALAYAARRTRTDQGQAVSSANARPSVAATASGTAT